MDFIFYSGGLRALVRAGLAPVWVVLGVALLVRLVAALAFPNIIAFDEIFQALEQAHRLVYGQGVVPWEFHVGLRNWVIPLALAGPMWVGKFYSGDPLFGLILIRVLLVLGSLPVVWCGFRWGERFYGVMGGWVVGMLCALWPDFWVMAPHPLEEVLAADILVPAVYFSGVATSLGRVGWCGFMLGCCFVLRMQVAPALLVVGVVLGGMDWRRWVMMVGAGVVPVLLVGGLDWYAWGQPFRSFWLYFYMNTVGGVADLFGTEPPGTYLLLLGLDWYWTFLVVIGLFVRGAWRLPVVAVAAVALLAAHSAIPHKEFRFIFPAVTLIVLVAGMGLAEFLVWGWGRRWVWVVGLAMMVGPLCSPFMYYELMYQRNSFFVFEQLRVRGPALVAIGTWVNSFVPLDILWPAGMRLTGAGEIAKGGPRPSFVLSTAQSFVTPAGYRLALCHSGHWAPFGGGMGPDFCIWEAVGAVADANAAAGAPALEFGYPPGGALYRIR